MTRSGYDKWKRNVLRCCLNTVSDDADVMRGGRLFQKLTPEAGKVCLPTVERLNGGTASWLKEVDRSLCRDGTSVTWVKYDDRCAGALPCTQVSWAQSSSEMHFCSKIAVNLGSGSWLAWANDISAHCVATHCLHYTVSQKKHASFEME